MHLIWQVELYFYKNFDLVSSSIFLGKIQAKWTGLSCFNFNWVKKKTRSSVARGPFWKKELRIVASHYLYSAVESTSRSYATPRKCECIFRTRFFFNIFSLCCRFRSNVKREPKDKLSLRRFDIFIYQMYFTKPLGTFIIGSFGWTRKVRQKTRLCSTHLSPGCWK